MEIFEKDAKKTDPGQKLLKTINGLKLSKGALDELAAEILAYARPGRFSLNLRSSLHQTLSSLSVLLMVGNVQT